MMYVNLIVRNLTRSVKEYVVYMTTLSISIMLIYAYNGLVYSPQMEILSDRLATFKATILVVSILIILIIAWLIYYISNFILQKRSKEFGMYLLMGMSRRQVSLMFLAEQVCLALVAFAIGCFLGTFAMQVMLMIIVGMLEQEFVLEIAFSMHSLGFTALAFLVIFIMECMREYHALMKFSIHDLLYSEKKNDEIMCKKTLSYLYCFLALLFFVIGYICLKQFLDGMSSNTKELGTLFFLISMVLLITSVYLWFFALSSLLTTYINKRKKIKYHGDTMYVFAQISGRLRSNRAILATLSVLILSTLMFVCLGFKFSEAQNIGAKHFFPFDINAYGGENLDVSSIQIFLKEEGIGYQEHRYQTYEMPKVRFSILDQIASEFGYFGSANGTYIKLSDYNALRLLNGKEEILMKDNEYILLVDAQYIEEVSTIVDHQILQISGKNLSLHFIDDEALGQTRMDIINVVVPDSLFQEANATSHIYNVKTDVASKTTWKEAFQAEFIKDNPSQQRYSMVSTQADWIAETSFSTMIMNVCLYYFAIIFTCVSATILATQQLSDSAKQRYAYAMLWRMGVAKNDVFKLMRKQIAIYFIVPMFIPLLYAVPLLYLLDDLFQKTTANASSIPYFLLSLVFYICMNIGYYFLAYYGCKQNVKESL